ncbi:phosphotransferase, partial [bacterium LRH843]|nr:phosphotransferase [bacterium LRH843]
DTVVLRDYHADNLMWLPERDMLMRVGLLDFQDALIGSAAYDLVSLLEDTRRDVSTELADAMLEYYLSKRGDLNPEEF